MKVKIKKEGNTKEFNLIKSWSDVTLEKWAKLAKLQGLTKGDEALETINTLSDIPKGLIKELGIQDVALIMSRLAELQSKSSSKLKNIIKLEGEEYGFMPNLEDITLGEWADLEHYIKEGYEDHLPEIMAVLYRNISAKKNNKYTIKAYDGNITIRAEKFKKMKAEQVQSALVFFWTLGNESKKILLLYLQERKQMIKELMKVKDLQKNGVTSV